MADLVGIRRIHREAVLAIGLDLVVLVVFVAIGRSAHRHGMTSSGMASTLWPFASGLALGWLVAEVAHLRPTSFRAGLVVVAFTVSVGMTLRVIAGQGTAVAFIVVSVTFLGATMIGWRVAFTKAQRHRDIP